jgi:hypothetical protein
MFGIQRRSQSDQDITSSLERTAFGTSTISTGLSWEFGKKEVRPSPRSLINDHTWISGITCLDVHVALCAHGIYPTVGTTSLRNQHAIKEDRRCDGTRHSHKWTLTQASSLTHKGTVREGNHERAQ